MLAARVATCASITHESIRDHARIGYGTGSPLCSTADKCVAPTALIVRRVLLAIFGELVVEEIRQVVVIGEDVGFGGGADCALAHRIWL
jgi:hypothetical protein